MIFYSKTVRAVQKDDFKNKTNRKLFGCLNNPMAVVTNTNRKPFQMSCMQFLGVFSGKMTGIQPDMTNRACSLSKAVIPTRHYQGKIFIFWMPKLRRACTEEEKIKKERGQQGTQSISQDFKCR